MDIRVGDTITLKKPHPCGGRDFLVTRTGMDIKIKCCMCGREVMVPRSRIEKNIKGILH